MRKVFTIVMSLIFGFSVLAISLISQSQFSIKSAFAETQAQTEEPTSLSDIEPNNNPATPSAQIVDYYLPYPGLLPDHPLYWIKMVRDRIKLWFTNDSLDKSELMLLYADKRIGAAQALVEGNRYNLAESTITKAEKYLQQATMELLNVDRDEEEAKLLWQRLYKASLKHQQAIQIISESAPDELKPPLEKTMAITESLILELKDVIEN